MYHTTLLWSEFVAERMAGLNLFVSCALSIDEFNKLSQKVNENGDRLKVVKVHRDVEQQVGNYLLW